MKLKPSIQLILLITTLIKLNLGIAQDINIIDQKFHPDSLKTAITELDRELTKKHPGYYRYNTKEEFDALIDSVQATISDSLTMMQAYAKLKFLISNIHCLHTELWHSNSFKNALDNQANLLPFQLYFQGKQAFIAKNYSNNLEIKPKDEVVSINDRSIEQILEQLLPLIPADGYNLSMKYRALLLQFPIWYRNIDLTSSFMVEVKKNEETVTHKVAAKKRDEIAAPGFLKPPSIQKQLAFKIENNIAYLTIHSFSNSDIKNGDQKFKKFLDEAFFTIQKNHIKNLIVDVRDNTGGSDSNAAYLTSYFFDEPFRYWDRIEVTEELAKEVKGLVRLFYKKPVEENGQLHWQKGKLTKEFDFYEEQEPAKRNYSGNTYLLINGFCMSSCADVAAILSHNKKVITIGAETGGGYQGNSSGMIPETVISPFGFNLSVPLQNYFNAVHPETNFGQGTIPDYPVTHTIASFLETEDVMMLKAVELINR